MNRLQASCAAPWCAVLLCAAVSAAGSFAVRVPAQEQAHAPPAEVDLGAFVATFERLPGDAPRVAIACLHGRPPLVLCGGALAGTAVSGRTWLPVGPLARLLYADALHVAGRLDETGAEAGERVWSAGDLLAGSEHLPRYVDWDGTTPAFDRAACLRAAELTADEPFVMLFRGPSMTELQLVEPVLLGDAHASAAAALNAMLGAAGPDWRCADAAGDGAPDRILGERGPGLDVRRARLAAARLLLTADDVARWWHWRTERDLPVWRGCRTGYVGFDGRWHAGDPGPGSPGAWVWPGEAPAALLLFGVAAADALVESFEACLPAPPARPDPAVGLGGGFAPRPLQHLDRSRWRPADGGQRLCMEVAGPRAGDASALLEGVRLQVRGVTPLRSGRLWIEFRPTTEGVRWQVLLAPAADRRRMEAILCAEGPRLSAHAESVMLERQRDR